MIDLIPADGWRRLACDFAWQTTLLGLAAVALLAIYAAGPAARSAVAVVAAGLFLAAPLATGWTRHYGWGFFAEPSRSRSRNAWDRNDSLLAKAPPTKIDDAATSASSRPSNSAPRKIDLAWRLACDRMADCVGGTHAEACCDWPVAVRRLYWPRSLATIETLLAELENASRGDRRRGAGALHESRRLTRLPWSPGDGLAC